MLRFSLVSLGLLFVTPACGPSSTATILDDTGSDDGAGATPMPPTGGVGEEEGDGPGDPTATTTRSGSESDDGGSSDNGSSDNGTDTDTGGLTESSDDGAPLDCSERPAFFLEPDSGHPRENLRIGPCSTFRVEFSTPYNTDTENLAKLQLLEVPAGADAFVVAGGPGCVTSALDLGPGAVPCLTFDTTGIDRNELEFWIDPIEFGATLEAEHVYRFAPPTLSSEDATAWTDDPMAFEGSAAHTAAFHDGCGSPLVPHESSSYVYEFTIDAPKCREDRDLDGVVLSCDNSPDHYNPAQGDRDRDGYGDVTDRCPTVASEFNTSDSDGDGVGNDCDSCRQIARLYNTDADAAGVPDYMRVRNIPLQSDADQDGIGDACDNCVVEPNCEDFGPGDPWMPGVDIAYGDPTMCQSDADLDMIGDQCAGQTGANAAGPVGFGDDDDFDQDGLANVDDHCPRQPVPRKTCTTNPDCGDGRTCTGGICNHRDGDGDRVGDRCDTCPTVANSSQVLEGGMQADDEDGDFVGDACEPAGCESRKDGRRLGFYAHSAYGYCCTTQYAELESRGPGVGVIVHPECIDLRVPVTPDCAEAEAVDPADPCHLANGDVRSCFKTPAAVLAEPGRVNLPPGCHAVLQGAGIDPNDAAAITSGNPPLDPATPDAWRNACLLPVWDSDMDGIGDACDLCPHDWDPDNRPYTDANDRLWPNNGHVCNGPFDISNKCSE